jgi:hypothetical protein
MSRSKPKPVMIAVIGDDGCVRALGWPSGAQGGWSGLSPEERVAIRKYLDRMDATASVTAIRNQGDER